METTNPTESEFIFEEITDPPPRAHPPEAGTQIERLSQVLRFSGAVVLIAAASVFLVQHWQKGNDIVRYALLLGFSGLMAAAAFLCGLQIRESKGARTLLGLTAASMPVHFAVLGGLIYSRLAIDQVSVRMAHFTSWVAPSATAALVTTLVAGPLLMVLIYLSFSALARDRARWLTGLFFVGNSLLLIPVRGPDFVAALVVCLVALLMVTWRKVFWGEVRLQTFEGGCVKIILCLPVVLILGRQFYLYNDSHLLLGSLWACLAILLFSASRLINHDLQDLIQGASALPAAMACSHLSIAARDAFALSASSLLPLLGLSHAIVLLTMSAYSVGSGKGYRRSAAIVATLCMIVNLLAFPGINTAMACLVLGIVGLGYGFYVEQKSILGIGAFSATLGLGYYFKHAVHFYSWSNWGVLAILGVAIILLASYLEKNHAALRHKVVAFHHRLKGWDY